jgi:1-acyl-sn-glycerol-3-phosphate acyltransferase
MPNTNPNPPPGAIGHLARRPRLFHRNDHGGPMDLSLPLNPPALTSRFRAIRRLVAVLLWTLPSALIQGVCLLLPGRAKVGFAKLSWGVFARLLGLHVQVIGQLASGESDRPVIYVSNHSSWIDIPVIGGVLDGCFVAKGDVAGWPIVGTIARLGRSVFVTRQRGSTVRERDTMQGMLFGGDNLILFPEGTSSDGSRVLPFRSSFFSVAQSEARPIIQPVSVVYDRLGGLPTGRANRPVFAWYGDMDIASHSWRLARCCGLRVTVLLHAPMDPARFTDRKALSQAVWRTVAHGAATLRQNRPALPLAVEDAAGEDAVRSAEAFA